MAKATWSGVMESKHIFLRKRRGASADFRAEPHVLCRLQKGAQGIIYCLIAGKAIATSSSSAAILKEVAVRGIVYASIKSPRLVSVGELRHVRGGFLCLKDLGAGPEINDQWRVEMVDWQ